MQKFKLCLMAAGQGTRNDRFLNLHKALLPLGNRPVISYILDCIDPATEVVIALGHLADQLRSYLEYVYPQGNFTFVMVDNYNGPGAGPGYSLLQCKDHLDCPFIFSSIDTLFNAKLDTPTKNWVGVAEVADPTGYCLVDAGPNGYVHKFCYDPSECLDCTAFIGIAGIVDHQKFWRNLAAKRTVNNEHQVINGFSDLAMDTEIFTWYDTGTEDRYAETLKHYPSPITTAKKDEVLYIDHSKVVKFFSDAQKVKNRCLRAQTLRDVVPPITQLSDHTYGYEYVLGNLLSHIYDEQLLDRFINFCKQFFRTGAAIDPSAFRSDCDHMYRVKTFQRAEPLENTEIDLVEKINGIAVQPIRSLLNRVDWDKIVHKAIPFTFHGDFQPENIILGWDDIRLLDWRDTFGNSTSIGDVYYDLSKLQHALIVNGTNVVDGKYSVEIRGSHAFVNIDSRYNLLLLNDRLKAYCEEQGFNWDHVLLLSALHYLNIASLYDDRKYREFLFLFGKVRLTKCLWTI